MATGRTAPIASRGAPRPFYGDVTPCGRCPCDIIASRISGRTPHRKRATCRGEIGPGDCDDARDQQLAFRQLHLSNSAHSWACRGLAASRAMATMALALTGRHPAGPLASADPGIGMKECLAARTAVAADSGHRSPPRVRRTRYLSRRIPLRMNAERWGADDSGRYHSVEEESGR